jgi:hypothetical protein
VVVFTPSTSPEKQNRWGLERKEGEKAEKQAAKGFERENRDVENFACRECRTALHCATNSFFFEVRAVTYGYPVGWILQPMWFSLQTQDLNSLVHALLKRAREGSYAFALECLININEIIKIISKHTIPINVRSVHPQRVNRAHDVTNIKRLHMNMYFMRRFTIPIIKKTNPIKYRIESQ